MKFILFSFALLFASFAGAETAGAGLPSTVWFQFINFGIYAVLLFFVLRKPLATFFKTRAETFHQALIKAESARAEAEKQRQDIEQRLQQLKGAADQSIAQARSEAEELRKRILAEAQELSRKLKDDAQRTAEIELQRAKEELREELLTQAVHNAKGILGEKIAEPDQRRLQTEFVEKIQVVRQ